MVEEATSRTADSAEATIRWMTDSTFDIPEKKAVASSMAFVQERRRFQGIINARAKLDHELYYKVQRKNYIHHFSLKTLEIKKNWLIINGILSSTKSSPKHPMILDDNGNVLSDSAAANKFNSYFANVGTNLAAKLGDSTLDFQNAVPPSPEFFAAFQPTNPIDTEIKWS